MRAHIRPAPIAVAAIASAIMAAPISAAAQLIGTNFTGATTPESQLLLPPDTNGAIGPSQYVQLMNAVYAVYDRSGNVLVKGTDTTFWANAGSPGGANSSYSDPRIVFDHRSNRWFAAETDLATNAVHIAVSKTANPLDGFVATSVSAGVSTDLLDYPTLGVNADSVQISANVFGNGNPTLWSIPKADLLLAAPTTANVSTFTDLDQNTVGFTLRSATDSGPSSGHTSVIGTFYPNGPMSSLTLMQVSNSGAALATLSSPQSVATLPYDFPPSASQPGAPNSIATNDPARSGGVYKVGDKIYAVMNTMFNGRAAVRWEVISDSTGVVLQEGTIGDSTHDYYFPSIAANDGGTVVIGFTRSGDSEYASAYAVVGEVVGGSLKFSKPILLKAGEATNPVSFRWGDYSATTLDPIDDQVFWTTQEFAPANPADGNIWATQVTEIDTRFAVVSVPEPGALALLAGLLIPGTALLIRRRK